MASKIEQFLNKILSSRYGKDVRQAIHDGIKQCYSDVTNPDLNTEAFETAVQNKIDSGALAAMTIADGSITKEKLDRDITENIETNTQDITNLKSALDIQKHEYTEEKIELTYVKYGGWDEQSNVSGTRATKPFKTPQRIKIVSHTTDYGVDETIKLHSLRFLSSVDPITQGVGNREASFMKSFNVQNGEEQTFDTYEYGRKDCEYMQLRFTVSNFNKDMGLFDVYAIYDTYRPTYEKPKPQGIFDEDLDVKYTFQGTHYGLNVTGLIAVAPYYPDFNYNIRGGYFSTVVANTLDVIYLLDDEIFNGYHNSIVGQATADAKDVKRILAGKTIQYDNSVEAGRDNNYAWSYHKTPPESELTGPKWIAICSMYVINQPSKTDLGQEYYNKQIQALNDSGPKLRYITKFDDKNAPRRLLSTYVKQIANQNDGTYYTTLLKQSDNPLAGKKWTLFGDSLTDAYGGHDLTGNYFASKIAREFGMILDNRAKSGGNINTGDNGNYTSINGCECLDQLISDVESEITDPPDYITVAYGTNGIKTQNGTVDDTSDNKETTCGAVKYFIEKCTEKFPNAFLGFVLPPLGSWKAEDGQAFPNEKKDVDAARAAIKSVLDLPEYGGIPYIDMSKKTGITLAMLPDKIHISTDQTNAKYYRALRGFLISAGV